MEGRDEEKAERRFAGAGSKMNSDILDTITKVRVAFMEANLTPPTTILLGTHDDGMRFLSAVRQSNTWFAEARSPDLGRPIEMADGSMWMEITLLGIGIRWPANKRALPDGSWSFV